MCYFILAWRHAEFIKRVPQDISQCGVHSLLPWQVITAYHAGIQYTARWGLLYLPRSECSPCKQKSRTPSLESQMSWQTHKTTGGWFALQDRAAGKSCLEFRGLMDRLFAKPNCVTWLACWRTPFWLHARQQPLSDWKEFIKKGEREQKSKYRRIGGLHVKYIIETH